MTWELAVSREYLERALSLARSRQDARELGVRICEVMEMQELDELRMLRTPACHVSVEDQSPPPEPPPVKSPHHLRRMQRALRGR